MVDFNEEALEACEQAIRLDPHNSDFYDNRGWILCMLDRDEEALASCEQAIQLDPHR